MIFKELRDSGGSQEIDHDDSEILHNVLELSNKARAGNDGAPNRNCCR
jgi:hypothetical protein